MAHAAKPVLERVKMRQVALVTGAGGGIGRAAAQLLAERGMAVGVLDWKLEGARATAALIEDAGGKAWPLSADVSDDAQMRAAVAALIEQAGRLDVLVVSAGINGVWAPVDELEADEWDKTLGVNLKGTFLAFKYGVPPLREHGGAAVIVSSLHGTRMFTSAGSTAYACSKAAQTVFAKKMALELARDKIRVNVVCPGSTKTGINDTRVLRSIDKIDLKIQFPQGKLPLTNRPAKPEEIAPLIAFLCSPEAAFITGAEVHIDGGMSLIMG